MSTSDQPVAQTSTWQHTVLNTDIHAPWGIRTHNLSKRAAVDPRLRPRGHWVRPTRCTNSSNLFLEWNSTCFRQFPCPSSGVRPVCRLRRNSSPLTYREYYTRCCINPLTPNDLYMSRTAPLTSKRCILYIYSTNIGTEYFKHGLYFPFFFSSKCSLFHNANFFGSCVIHILYTGCAKIKKK